MIAWFIKLALGNKIKQMFASPVALGAIILCLVILWYYLFNHLPVVRERDVAIAEKTQAVKALNDYAQATNAAASIRIKENAIKEAVAKASVNEITQERQIALDALAKENVTHEQSKQQVRELVDALKFNQTRILDINRNWSNRVRAEAANSAARMPETAANTEKSTSGRRECNADDFRVVVDACKLTTIDFNTCRNLLDADALVCERSL